MTVTPEHAKVLLRGPFADRPLASVGRYWYLSDEGGLYKSNGSAWTEVVDPSGPVSFGTPSPTWSTIDAIGSSGKATQSDATYALFVASLPSTQAFGDSASAGTVAFPSRLDHKHAMPASPAVSFGTPAPTWSTVDAIGSSGKAVQSDATFALFDGAVSSTQAFSDTATAGTVDFAARRDHKHAMPSLGTAATQAAAGNDSRLSDSRAPSGSAGGDLTGTYPNPTLGTAAFAIPAIILGSSAAAGSTSDAVRSDSTIAAFDATVPTTQTYGDAAAVGTAAFAARRDHVHAMPALATIGGAAWTIVSKSGDTARAATTSATADPDLAFTAASGATYEIFVFLVYASPLSAGVPDIKIGVGEDTTARGALTSKALSTTDSAVGATFLTNQGAPWTAGTAVANRVWQAQGVHVGAGGSFQVLWAQNTSDANPTTVRGGTLGSTPTSFIAYRRMG